MKQAASPIRFVLIALIALAFGAVSIAAAQQANSQNAGYNVAWAQVQSNGDTIDQVEFTIPNYSVTHPYGNFRPDAYIRVAVPITNNTDRAVDCSAAAAPTGLGTVAGELERGGRLVTLVTGSAVRIAANSTANLNYFLAFASGGAWLDTDWDAGVSVPVRVTCTGVLPTITNLSH